MQHDTVVVVVAGGGYVGGAGLRGQTLLGGVPVIAADGGLDLARAIGVAVDVVVGDLDSVTAAGVAAAEEAGARIVKHPVAKDATDLELALDEAIALEPRRVVVLGGAAGRLDHLLSLLLLLGAEKYAGVELDAHLGAARVHVVRAERRLRGTAGEVLSLLAVHGPAEDVVTEGLVYPLRGETLLPGSSRGVSNAFEGEHARVRLGRGVLLAVGPGAGR